EAKLQIVGRRRHAEHRIPFSARRRAPREATPLSRAVVSMLPSLWSFRPPEAPEVRPFPPSKALAIRPTAMKFTKMHGLGNDYVYVETFTQPEPADPVALARAVSDRHFGVGSDGLIIIMPSDRADARMR